MRKINPRKKAERILRKAFEELFDFFFHKTDFPSPAKKKNSQSIEAKNSDSINDTLPFDI